MKKRNIPSAMKKVCSFVAITCIPLATVAAPGILSEDPLFIGNAAQPNILFVVDDSGSMDWEILKSNGAREHYLYGDADPPFRDDGDIDITPTPGDRREMLESCSGYNVMYFDPNNEYPPWIGVDSDGNAFADQSVTSARYNPYYSGDVIDLTDHWELNEYTHPPGYFVWNDSDEDGELDVGECPDPALPGFNYRRDFIATVGRYGNTEMTEEMKVKFANWFTYYRKREYVVKAALSGIINDATSRMGLVTLHNNDDVATEVKSIDDVALPINKVAQQNKIDLMDNLFQVRSQYGTPLRRTLNHVGRYFHVNGTPGDILFGSNPPSSPIVSEAEGGACQQNFTVLMSDGFWNGSAPSVGNTDGDDNSDFDGGSYADNYENTLADVAMRYYERDLAPDLPNSVPTTEGVDNNAAQHMVTYTVAFGVNGTLSDDPESTTEAFSWPQPFANESSTIDDMRHAAWNGRGEFLSAKNPQELSRALSRSIESIEARTASASSVAFNTTNIRADTFVYQASFDTKGWHGTLKAFRFDEGGVVAGGPVWDAAELLNDSGFDWEDRAIFTYRPDTEKGIPFAFPDSYQSRLSTSPDDAFLNSDQIRDILAGAELETRDTDAIADNQAYGQAVVNYIRGDFSNDGLAAGDETQAFEFRDRGGRRLGDIVHSSPEFVGVPNERYPNNVESTRYSDFIAANQGRRGVVYVGANDGMLHAFDSNTGEELFAYVPAGVYSDTESGLNALLQAEFGHTPHVDGSPVSRDVFIPNVGWRSYLVGGLRAGGKSVYVLDVTNPNDFLQETPEAAENLVVTEFMHEDLGFTFSKPQIVRMNNGSWAAVFGNGYNNDGDGTAKLFILFLDGTNDFVALETGVGSSVNNDCADVGSDCNGLSSPSVVDVDGDFNADRIYAGDLHGNLWVFDVSDADPGNWGTAFGSRSSPEPLFTACSGTLCTAANRQPITSKPIAVGHPSTSSPSTFPNVMVMFGTGQYIAVGDNATTDRQSFYGIWDAGGDNNGFNRTRLVEQEIQAGPADGNQEGGRTLTTNLVNYSTSDDMGWYIDLAISGSAERVVVDPVVGDSLVFFNTTIPAEEKCVPGGTGYLMVANIKNGGQPPRKIFETVNRNGNSTPIDGDYAGLLVGAIPAGGVITNGDVLVAPTSLGDILSADLDPIDPNKNSRRASWSIVK